MTEVVYRIIHAPSGKHHLKKYEDTIGFYDTHDLAFSGLERTLRPVVTEFDKDGILIVKET